MKTIKLQDLSNSFDNYERKSMKQLFSDLSNGDTIFTVIGHPYFEIGEHIIKDIIEKDDCIEIMTNDNLEMIIYAKCSTITNPNVTSKNKSEVRHNFIVGVSTNFFKVHHTLKEMCMNYNEALTEEINKLTEDIENLNNKKINLSYFN